MDPCLKIKDRTPAAMVESNMGRKDGCSQKEKVIPMDRRMETFMAGSCFKFTSSIELSRLKLFRLTGFYNQHHASQFEHFDFVSLFNRNSGFSAPVFTVDKYLACRAEILE